MLPMEVTGRQEHLWLSKYYYHRYNLRRPSVVFGLKLLASNKHKSTKRLGPSKVNSWMLGAWSESRSPCIAFWVSHYYIMGPNCYILRAHAMRVGSWVMLWRMLCWSTIYYKVQYLHIKSSTLFILFLIFLQK